MNLRMVLIVTAAALAGGLGIAAAMPGDNAVHVGVAGPTTPEGAYVAQARERGGFVGITDESLIRVGRGFCEAFAQATDATVRPVPVSGISDRELHVLVDASTRYLCPTARTKVAGYLRDDR